MRLPDSERIFSACTVTFVTEERICSPLEERISEAFIILLCRLSVTVLTESSKLTRKLSTLLSSAC